MSPNTVKRSTRVNRTKKIKRPVARGPPPVMAMAVLLVGMMLLLSSLAVPWATLKVKTKLGPIPVTLDAQVSEYGVSYTADLSGTQGLIQGTGDINKKITDKKVFITGLGSFQELIGFIKGSSKYRNHTIEIFTKPENTATVVIETYAATIPWWPVGVSEPLTVTVRMSEVPQNISHVNIKKVWIELHQTVNGQDRFKVLWETNPTSDKLTKMGDRMSYSTKVVIDSDLGNFSVVGRAQLELIDKDNVAGSGPGHEIKSFIDNPKMINLWTISNGRTARIAMLLMAMPLTVLSMVLMVVSAIASYARSRWAWKLAAIAAILGLLSVAFYYLGVGALIELTGYGKWFGWSPAGPALAALGGTLGLIGCVLLFVNNRKDGPIKVPSDHPEDEEVPEALEKEKTKQKAPTNRKSKKFPTDDSEE
jgi:hypothetical protein